MTPGKDINGMGIGLDESEFDFCNFVSLYFFFLVRAFFEGWLRYLSLVTVIELRNCEV
jgi:hypothetical protein